MEIRGDLNVRRTGIFDRRADQGLFDHTISTSLALLRHSEYFQKLEATTSNDLVILPDATTLPEGWEVVIINDGAVALKVEDDQDSATLTDIAVNEANRYILLDNGTAAGTWFVEPMQSPDITAATRYTTTFNATSDWGSAAGGYYTITVAQSTHLRGTTPSVRIYISDGGTGFNIVEPDQSKVAANGDVSFRVPDSPDLRFAGMIVLI